MGRRRKRVAGGRRGDGLPRIRSGPTGAPDRRRWPAAAAGAVRLERGARAGGATGGASARPPVGVARADLPPRGRRRPARARGDPRRASPGAGFGCGRSPAAGVFAAVPRRGRRSRLRRAPARRPRGGPRPGRARRPRSRRPGRPRPDPRSSPALGPSPPGALRPVASRSGWRPASTFDSRHFGKKRLTGAPVLRWPR